MAATLKGMTVEVSFASFLYTGYVAEDVVLSYPNGNIEVIPDADGATMTKIFMDPGTKIEATVVILSAGSIDPPADGDAVGIDIPDGTLTTFMSEGSSARHVAGATRLSLSLIKETSMTYS